MSMDNLGIDERGQLRVKIAEMEMRAAAAREARRNEPVGGQPRRPGLVKRLRDFLTRPR